MSDAEIQPGSCKCGSQTLAGHTIQIEQGYPAHVYTGLFSDWAAADTTRRSDD